MAQRRSMRKANLAVLRDLGRLILSGTVAHGLTTSTWREWRSLGLTVWLAGEIGYALA